MLDFAARLVPLKIGVISTAPSHSSSFGVDLVRGTLAGDPRATRELVKTVLIPVSEAAVCREALRVRRGRIDVEDALQEVLHHLCEDGWARLRGFDPERGPLAAYVSRIARNYTIDLLRRRPPPEPVEDVESNAVPDSGPEGKVQLGQQLDRLTAAFGEEDLLLIRWLWFEELDRTEIAGRLGISVQALYKRSQRLEAKVRGVLSNEDGEDRKKEEGPS